MESKKATSFQISPVKSQFLDEIPVYFIEVRGEENFLPPFDFIIIKNFYTHTVNIVQFAEEKWKCCLELKLMTDPDCDEEAEKYVVIHRKQLEENGYLQDKAEVLRFYLVQDSTLWNSFSIKEIKFLTDEAAEGNKLQI